MAIVCKALRLKVITGQGLRNTESSPRLATPAAVGAAQQATSTIPIVMSYSTDPVGSGFIASLARPGGNTTGLASSLDLDSPAVISTGGRRQTAAAVGVTPVQKLRLPADKSAVRRDQLIEELSRLGSMKEIDPWAHQVLPVKNTLTATDAQLVESAFQKKLTALGNEPILESPEATQRLTEAQVAEPTLETIEPVIFSEPITRRRAVAAKTIRLRDKEHRKFVATQPCLVCGRSPADAHHLRFAQPRALGRKVSDEFTVPVCRAHHRELHSHGDEVSWWKRIDLDPLPIALKLWQHSRPNGTEVTEIDVHDTKPIGAVGDVHQ
jgi:ABC transporter substrate binding protein